MRGAAAEVNTLADLLREEGVHEITSLGGTTIYVVISLILLLIGRGDRAALVALGYLVSLVIACALREVKFKPRPTPRSFRTHVGRLWASSFPSLHAMRAFLFAVVFAGWTGAVVAYPFFLVLAVSVAWSRVVLRMHHPTDVIAGGAMGLVLGGALGWFVP